MRSRRSRPSLICIKQQITSTRTMDLRPNPQDRDFFPQIHEAAEGVAPNAGIVGQLLQSSCRSYQSPQAEQRSIFLYEYARKFRTGYSHNKSGEFEVIIVRLLREQKKQPRPIWLERVVTYGALRRGCLDFSVTSSPLYLPRIPSGGDITGRPWQGCHNSAASFKACAAGFPLKSVGGREKVSLPPRCHRARSACPSLRYALIARIACPITSYNKFVAKRIQVTDLFFLWYRGKEFKEGSPLIPFPSIQSIVT